MYFPPGSTRKRPSIATEAERAEGREALDFAAGRAGYDSWNVLLGACNHGAAPTLLRIEFGPRRPFGLHEEFGASLRVAGMQMRAMRFGDIVVGRSDVLAFAGPDYRSLPGLRVIVVTQIGEIGRPCPDPLEQPEGPEGESDTTDIDDFEL